MFYPIRDQSKETTKLEMSELEKYMTFKFFKSEIDWSINKIERTEISAQPCTVDHFGGSEAG